MLEKISLIAAIVLPFWNIPLILKIIKRKSSKDISLSWALGIWTCLLLMLPAGLASVELIWKVFCITNFILFSSVMITVLIYRSGKKSGRLCALEEGSGITNNELEKLEKVHELGREESIE